MWKNWLNGILGLWVVLIPFLNFSLAWQRTVLIFSGVVIAIFGFWSFYEARLRAPLAQADLPASPREAWRAGDGQINPRHLSVDESLNETTRPLASSAQADLPVSEEKKIEI